MARMFLNGSAMSGGPLHHHLRGAPLVMATKTAPGYRLFSVRDAFPGVWADAANPAAVAGEVYEVSDEVLRDELLPSEPPELEFGIIKLADGSASFSMLLRRSEYESGKHHEISEYGGWRAYLASIE